MYHSSTYEYVCVCVWKNWLFIQILNIKLIAYTIVEWIWNFVVLNHLFFNTYLYDLNFGLLLYAMLINSHTVNFYQVESINASLARSLWHNSNYNQYNSDLSYCGNLKSNDKIDVHSIQLENSVSPLFENIFLCFPLNSIKLFLKTTKNPKSKIQWIHAQKYQSARKTTYTIK